MNAQQGTIQLLYLPVQVPCTSQPMQRAAEASSITAGCVTIALRAKLRERLDSHPDGAIGDLCVHDGSECLPEAAQLV